MQSKAGWWQFIALCQALKTKEETDAFFDFLLTPEEKENISTRCLITYDLLKDQKSQREMAQDLNVSISKITRGSNALKKINKNLKEFLMKHMS